MLKSAHTGAAMPSKSGANSWTLRALSCMIARAKRRQWVEISYSALVGECEGFRMPAFHRPLLSAETGPTFETSTERNRGGGDTSATYGDLRVAGVCCRAVGMTIPQLIENSGEFPCVLWLRGFGLANNSRRLPWRRGSGKTDRVGARRVGGLSCDAAGQRDCAAR